MSIYCFMTHSYVYIRKYTFSYILENSRSSFFNISVCIRVNPVEQKETIPIVSGSSTACGAPLTTGQQLYASRGCNTSWILSTLWHYFCFLFLVLCWGQIHNSNIWISEASTLQLSYKPGLVVSHPNHTATF